MADARSPNEKLQRHGRGPAAWPDARARFEHAGSCDQLVECLQGDDLSGVIEQEIIPRLMLAHNPRPELLARLSTPNTDSAEPGLEPHKRLAALMLGSHAEEALEYIDALFSSGMREEEVFLEVLAPTARLLGTMWERDEASFVDVTIGLGRLQQIVRRYTSACTVQPSQGENVKSILLRPAPGEQHTFGLLLVEDTFRKEGWEVHCGGNLSDRAIEKLIEDRNIKVIGLSLSCETMLDRLKGYITSIRSSRGEAVRIVVGGSIFARSPEAWRAVGADATASDANDAVAVSTGLLQAALRS